VPSARLRGDALSVYGDVGTIYVGDGAIGAVLGLDMATIVPIIVYG